MDVTDARGACGPESCQKRYTLTTYRPRWAWVNRTGTAKSPLRPTSPENTTGVGDASLQNTTAILSKSTASGAVTCPVTVTRRPAGNCDGRDGENDTARQSVAPNAGRSVSSSCGSDAPRRGTIAVESVTASFVATRNGT